MIVIPSGLAGVDGRSLKNALIGYQTYTFDLTAAAVTADDTDDGPKDAPLRPDTAEFWETPSLPATWVLDLGQARTIDYVALAGHTLGSNGCTIQIDASDDDLDAYVRLPGDTSNYISTPHSSAIASAMLFDFEIEIWAAADDWSPAATQTLASKLGSEAGADQSWHLSLRSDGALRFRTSVDGTNGTNNHSTIPVSADPGEKLGILVTYDSSGGSPSDAQITFYTATDQDNPDWVQLGAPVSYSGGGSLFANTLPIELGSRNSGAVPFAGKIYKFVLRGSIGAPTDTVHFDAADGATGATTVQHGSPGETWTINRLGSPAAQLINNETANLFSDSHAPADDSPIVFLDAPVSARYVRLRVTGSGSTMPRVAVIYVGAALAMERAIRGGGHAPITLSRQSVLHRSLSRGGQFLGQGFRRNGLAGAVAFQNLSQDWVREDFEPFVEHARSLPYFFAWRPQTHPDEVAFVWTGEDIVPNYQGLSSLMQVSWNMQGIGSE